MVAGPRSELAQRAQKAGLPLIEVAIGNLSFLNPFKLVQLYRLFRKVSVGSLILNLPSDVKAAGLAARLAGVQRIIYRRGSALPIRDTWFNRFLFRYIVDEIIANSEETKRTILAKNPHLFPEEKIHVIYNGMDLQQFDLRLSRGSDTRPSGRVVLGHAGRLSSEKNQKFLIDVTRELIKAGLNCCLHIAGTGPLEKALQDYAVENGLREEVVFLGFQEDVSPFMASIDIFLLSSRWEGFGYVLIEAMAAKKPVVAFASSSTPEIVENGKTGHLVPPGDLGAFVRRVKELSLDPQQRLVFGRAGRERVENLFTCQHAFAALKNLLGLS
jgi:glycosyltransferase involved in cell wall biosynthesis